MDNNYLLQAEMDYRRDRVREQTRPVTRRRRERAEAVRRVLRHLR